MKCVMAMKKTENKLETKPKVNTLSMSDKFSKNITGSDKLKKPLSKSIE
jgi:hypothetical protein